MSLSRAGTPVARATSIFMPMSMRTLERDSRGYPIPFIVLRDKSGQPQFTINDVRKTNQCHTKRLCSICGKRMPSTVWFVGGSRCFLHADGAFLDPPMHLECATYALIVCPFLAASKYSRRIDDAKLDPKNTPDNLKLVRTDFMMPRLPERFGLGMTTEYHYERISPRPGEFIFTVRQWGYVEWWRAGSPVEAPESSEPPR
jgi:hypothetical protein